MGAKNPSLSNMGEGFINSWNFLPVLTPLGTIHKTTAVWASQKLLGIYYGYASPDFENFTPHLIAR